MENSERLVIGYIRVSSMDQVRDEQSLPRQQEQVAAYCKLKGLSEPMIIADEGVSGFKEKRHRFQQSGHAHTCVLAKEGQIKCWGSNKWGELGTDDTQGHGQKLGMVQPVSICGWHCPAPQTAMS